MLLPKPDCTKNQSRDPSLICMAQSPLSFLYFLFLHRAPHAQPEIKVSQSAFCGTLGSGNKPGVGVGMGVVVWFPDPAVGPRMEQAVLHCRAFQSLGWTGTCREPPERRASLTCGHETPFVQNTL